MIIVPSILSADFARLGEQVREAVAAGGERIQVDVMDGDFVPNLSMGPAVVEAVRRVTEVPIEVHLMVERPERFIDAFVKAGADFVQVHVEATYSLYRTVHAIREAGARPGVALNPGTPVESLDEILPYVDQVNVLTIEPGFGGQAMIETAPDKVRRVRSRAPERVEIEVDGGVDEHTAPRLAAAGAGVFVAGNAVFAYPGGIAAGVRAIREAVHARA